MKKNPLSKLSREDLKVKKMKRNNKDDTKVKFNNDENAMVRKAVASAAGILVRDGKEVRFVTRATFSFLVELLKDKDGEVKSEARSALLWKLLWDTRHFEELLKGKNAEERRMVNDEMRRNNCQELLR